MIRFVIGFILSVVITNWAYSELLLIDPSVEDIVSEASELLTLPTHDEWQVLNLEDLVSDSKFKLAGVKLAEAGSCLSAPLFHVTDRLANIKRLVADKRKGAQAQSQQKPFEMVSDDEIFIKHM